jgi:alkylhydroperoxidase/carboxymuconolactone decarboxylase family protein YurZ
MSNETIEYEQTADRVTGTPTGPWDSALDKLRDLDPKWAEVCFKMSTNPWTHSVLPRKFIELVSISLNAAYTNLNAGGTRHHIRAALEAGTTREEVLFVLKCGSALPIHSCSLAAPIVVEEAKAATACPY